MKTLQVCYKLVPVFFSLAACVLAFGCMIEENSCVSCHTDKEKLKELADPIAAIEDDGEG